MHLGCRAQQGKAQTAVKPTQDNRILIIPLSTQMGSQMLTKGSGLHPMPDKIMATNEAR